MAMNKPRSYDQARVNILAACRRPEFAGKVEYSKPVWDSASKSKKAITGPSIRFAELALREWGNIFYENQVVYDDDMVRRVRVTVIDLQTNTTFGKEVQITKTVERRNGKDREILGQRVNSNGETVYVVKATEDEIMTREASMISKALRNEGLRLIPQEIIEEGLRTAQMTMQERDKRDPDAARKAIVDAFVSIGVSPTDLEKYLKHPVAQCVPAELKDLRTIYQTIRDSEAKWIDYVTSDDPDPEKKPDDDMKAKLLGTSKGSQPPSEKLTPLTSPTTPKKAEQPKSDSGPGDFPLNDEPRPSGGITELEKLRDELRTGLLLGLKEDEIDGWCVANMAKPFLDLRKDDLRTAIRKFNAEMDSK
jgi:hypothetical protein